ncbi:unnamed protein product [Prunus armeniaca]
MKEESTGSVEQFLLEGCNHDDPIVAERICCPSYHLLKGYEEQELSSIAWSMRNPNVADILFEDYYNHDSNVAENIRWASFHLYKGYKEKGVNMYYPKYEESKWVFTGLHYCLFLKGLGAAMIAERL